MYTRAHVNITAKTTTTTLAQRCLRIASVIAMTRVRVTWVLGMELFASCRPSPDRSRQRTVAGGVGEAVGAVPER